MVSIVAFQAVDPGSIPGPRILLQERRWCIGNIEASQALAPGSTPGRRNQYFSFPFGTFMDTVSLFIYIHQSIELMGKKKPQKKGFNTTLFPSGPPPQY